MSIANPNVPKIYNVNHLKELLQDVDGFTDIKHTVAITPIVKFNVPAMGLICDLNTNDMGGW